MRLLPRKWCVVADGRPFYLLLWSKHYTRRGAELRAKDAPGLEVMTCQEARAIEAQFVGEAGQGSGEAKPDEGMRRAT